jgi:hypothetical protein
LAIRVLGRLKIAFLAEIGSLGAENNKAAKLGY